MMLVPAVGLARAWPPCRPRIESVPFSTELVLDRAVLHVFGGSVVESTVQNQPLTERQILAFKRPLQDIDPPLNRTSDI